MNRKQTVAPDSIMVYPHLYAFDVVMRQMLGEIPVETILVYFFDTVPAALLPVLAEQFDLLGVKGWDFATTEADQRALLKNVIRLKRKKGTQWAVEEAIKVAGYTQFDYKENVNNNWGTFRIRLDINTYSIDVTQVTKAVQLVEEYKRKSAWFEGFYFYGLQIVEEVTMDDDLSVSGASHFSDSVTTARQVLRDGSIVRNGTQNYSTETDTIKLRIV